MLKPISMLLAERALHAVTALRDRIFFTPTKISVGMPSIAKNFPVKDAA